MNFVLLARPYSSSTSNTLKKSSTIIRNEFLDYFKKDLGHTFIRSSPVTPANDQTVAFVNAGMNQFKGIFLDYHDPPATKVTNSQKCIRISGKHNDLNLVGNDTYHHTFFEMLGNWSFGDYFKGEACRYAWDLLTKQYGVNKEFLYVTYFAGDEKLGLEPDLECKDIWLSIGVSRDKVLPFGLRDNFWEMGTSGPCGACTEIHVDHRKRMTNQSTRVNKGYADLTELWNIVFIQHERLINGSIVPLSKRYVDTGMGLERLVALLQGKESNYDTDLFQPLFKSIQKCTKAPAYKGKFHGDENELDTGYRMLADHGRMISVALADGMVPDENYKLRKIIRKAIDVGERVFKMQGILSELSCAVADNLGSVYPELHENLKKVQSVIKFEEELFENLRNTSGKEWEKMVKARPELALVTDWMSPGLVGGYKYLQSTLKHLETANVLPGNVALKLYDTYGLSAETVIELAKIDSLHFDEEALKNELENLKYRSKAGVGYNSKMAIELLEKNHVPRTNDIFKYEYAFNGKNCQFPTIESRIIGLLINGNLILNVENESMNIDLNTVSNGGDEIGIILDRTVCYSLEGGQTSDNGFIHVKDLIFNINDVRKIDNYVVHFGRFLQDNSKNSDETVKVGDSCVVSIDPELRIGAMQHHTAAHLLHASLMKIMQVVYPHSSFVLPRALRFQFNCFGEKLALEQLNKVEVYVNSAIKANVPVTTKILNSSELLAEDSLTLLPGETYPYTGIRVVEIDTDDLRSKEACCGTHVPETGVLEHFCLLSYSSKGAARFTIKAVTGPLATSAKLAGENLQRDVSKLEHELKTGKVTYEVFKSLSKEIENEISDGNKKMLIPYLVKEECRTKLKDLDKTAWAHAKEMEKSVVSTDIKSARNSSFFIVHCLHKNPTYLSLHEIVSLYPNTPIMILSCEDSIVKARCSIPQEIANAPFNAQTWMKTVLEVFHGEYSKNKGFNDILFASMKSTNISETSSERLVERAIGAARTFVTTHVRKD